MPGEHGFNICEELKGSDEFADIPVLMLTSFSQKAGETSIPVSQGFGLEAEDYIDKPVQPAVLLDRIEGHLKRRR
jgi:DNA-binding response OmpR family regulator